MQLVGANTTPARREAALSLGWKVSNTPGCVSSVARTVTGIGAASSDALPRTPPVGVVLPYRTVGLANDDPSLRVNRR